MIGAGKYDALCSYVRREAKAAGAIVMVFGGMHGEGFSAQLPPMLDGFTVARVLRDVAAQIERDAVAGTGRPA